LKQLFTALLIVALTISNPLPGFSAKGKVNSRALLRRTASQELLKTDRLIVKYKKSARKISVINQSQSLSGEIERLENNPKVEYAEPDYKREAFLQPNDEYYNLQWGLKKIQAPAAWDLETASTDPVIIGVVDTGVDLVHPDLVDKIVPGFDVANNDSVPQDDNGHGTHVAGVAAASVNNAYGVAGVSREAKIMPIKVLDAEGSGYDSWVAEGIRQAVDRGADIINLSLGGESYSQTLQQATDYAYSHNVLVVAAAGNSGDSAMMYPAGNPNVLAVGATTANDTLADFSTHNSSVDVSAPGEEIASTYWSSGSHAYAYMSGTSMATPFVSGLAASVKNKWPEFGASDISSRITDYSDDIGPYGRDNYFGAGRINAYSTLNASSAKVDLNVKGIVQAGRKTVLKGRMKPAQGGQPVKLYQKPSGNKQWSFMKESATDASGGFIFGVHPKRNTVYKIRIEANDTLSEVSKEVRVKVKPLVKYHIKRIDGRRIKVWGQVRPRKGTGHIAIKMVVRGKWRVVKRLRAKAGNFGTYINAKPGLSRLRLIVSPNKNFTAVVSRINRVK